MGLVAILAFLVFLLFFIPSEDKKKNADKDKEETKPAPTPSEEESMPTDLDSLRQIIRNKNSTTETLSKALDLVIKYHGTVHTKLGVRSHPDFDAYAEILFTICRHRNANKDIIIKFDRSLASLNPDYKEDINEAMTKGLNSRRV